MMQRIINELSLPILISDLQKRQLTAAAPTPATTNMTIKSSWNNSFSSLGD
jgi:hypothetical protein